MPALLIVLTSFISVLLIWVIILFLFAQSSGWSRLATQYQTEQPFSGQISEWQFGQVGWVNINGGLTVGTSPEFLYLNILVILKPWFPALLIPWADVTKVERVDAFLFQGYRLYVGSPAITTVTLRQETVSAVVDILEAKRGV